MGWDVTYHPVSEQEFQKYFELLANPSLVDSLAERFGVKEAGVARIRRHLEAASGFGDDMPYNKGHGFCLAAILGELRKYHYIRGGAVSFIVDIFAYVTDIEELVPVRYRHLKFNGGLAENYSSGFYMSAADLRAIQQEYGSDSDFRQAMDEGFSQGRLAVFWKAVDEALAQDLGLLEATEVTEPNPFDLNSSKSYSNLLNCHTEGPLLYAEAAAEQMRAAQAHFAAVDNAKKKGFWAKLFGK